MDFAPIILLLGVLTFPVVTLVLSARHRVGAVKFFKALWKTPVASGYNIEVTNLYTAMIFTPNVVGVLATVIAQFSSSFNLSKGMVLEIQNYHLGLLVLASVGSGLTRIGGVRMLPLFLGEVVSCWAFLSGVFLFVYYLALAEPTLGMTLTLTMIGSVILFTIAALVFMIEKSAGTYLTLAVGTNDAKTKTQPED